MSPGGNWLQNWSAKRSDKSSLPFGTYNIYREGILTCPTPPAALYGGGGGHKVRADRSMHLIKMNKKYHIFWSFFIHFSATLGSVSWLVLLKRWRYLIRHIMQSPLELIKKTSQKCSILEDFYKYPVHVLIMFLLQSSLYLDLSILTCPTFSWLVLLVLSYGTSISECGNVWDIDFRMRKRMGHRFQSAETYGTSISECGNVWDINFRVRKRMRHPFQNAETYGTSISFSGNHVCFSWNHVSFSWNHVSLSGNHVSFR